MMYRNETKLTAKELISHRIFYNNDIVNFRFYNLPRNEETTKRLEYKQYIFEQALSKCGLVVDTSGIIHDHAARETDIIFESKDISSLKRLEFLQYLHSLTADQIEKYIIKYEWNRIESNKAFNQAQQLAA